MRTWIRRLFEKQRHLEQLDDAQRAVAAQQAALEQTEERELRTNDIAQRLSIECRKNNFGPNILEALRGTSS